MLKKVIRDVSLVIKMLGKIFRSPGYLLVTLFSASAVFVISIWLPNFGLMKSVIFSESISFFDKFIFLWNSLGAIQTNFTSFAAFMLIAVSILLGVNMSMVVYYFRKRIAFQKASGGGIVGVLLGLVGVGCASCGSIVLSSLIGVGAAASFVGFLPLKGQEFSILSIIVLLFALYITAKKASDPLVCDV